jgi:hypothetical protein
MEIAGTDSGSETASLADALVTPTAHPALQPTFVSALGEAPEPLVRPLLLAASTTPRSEGRPGEFTLPENYDTTAGGNLESLSDPMDIASSPTCPSALEVVFGNSGQDVAETPNQSMTSLPESVSGEARAEAIATLEVHESNLEATAPAERLSLRSVENAETTSRDLTTDLALALVLCGGFGLPRDEQRKLSRFVVSRSRAKR